MATCSEETDAKASYRRGNRLLPIASVCVMAVVLPSTLWSTEKPTASREDTPTFSLAELHKFDGKSGQGENNRILLAVWGRVFDVSTGSSEFYGPGQGYTLFAGHDCTRAFALTSTKKKWLDQNLDGISERQLQNLNTSYWSTYVHKYPIVGKLTDPPYDASLYDQYAGPYGEIKPSPSALAAGTQQPSNSRRVSKCPLARAAKAVGSAIVSMLPRQLLPA